MRASQGLSGCSTTLVLLTACVTSTCRSLEAGIARSSIAGQERNHAKSRCLDTVPPFCTRLLSLAPLVSVSSVFSARPVWQYTSVVAPKSWLRRHCRHFIKCTPLCSNLEMYLGNDLPLIVKYDVASLGEIKLCLAPLPPS